MRVKYVLLLLLWILPAHAQVAADKVDQIRKELFNPASGKVLVAAIAVTGVMLAKTHWKP